MGTTPDDIRHSLRLAVNLLKKYDIFEDVLYILGEDGTSCKKRMDIVKEKISGNWRVMCHGLAEGPLIVESVDQLYTEASRQGLASTFYVVSLIPLVDGAPAIPIVVTANANDFDAFDVHRILMAIYAIANEDDIGLGRRIVGDVSDGDSRLRRLALQLMFSAKTSKGKPSKVIAVDHPLVQLKLPFIDGHGFHAQLMDPLHITWRLRTNFLNRELSIGNLPIDWKTVQYPSEQMSLGLNKGDLNGKDKQRWDSCMRLIGRLLRPSETVSRNCRSIF